MEDFDPERSSREMRKVNRRIYRETYVSLCSAFGSVHSLDVKLLHLLYEGRQNLIGVLALCVLSCFSLKKNQVYDEIGRILADSRDLCDCLQAQCPGCHFPCNKCDSTKCGMECRCSRRWYYSEIEIEGTDQKVTFPEPLPQPSY